MSDNLCVRREAIKEITYLVKICIRDRYVANFMGYVRIASVFSAEHCQPSGMTSSTCIHWNRFWSHRHTYIYLRPNCNVFGYIDWTTGLLLSENSSEVYLEQQHQSQQHQHLLPQPTPPTALPTTIALPRPPTQSPTHLRLQPQQGLPITSPPLSLSLTPIIQLTNTSTHYTPSYTIAPTTEIVINSTAYTH
jgi:hypothetical protein